MAASFEIIGNQKLIAAPGVELEAGVVRLRALDAAGHPADGQLVHFNVLYGGVRFIDGVERVTAIEVSTSASGEVDLPPLLTGPEEGVQAIVAQTPHASLEVLIRATHDVTHLLCASAVPVMWSRPNPPLRVTIEAVAKTPVPGGGQQDRPVQGLAVEVEVTSSAATIQVQGGRLSPPGAMSSSTATCGHYDLRRTGFDGKMMIEVNTFDSRNFPAGVEVPCTLRVTPYWHRQVVPLEVEIPLKPLHLLNFCAKDSGGLLLPRMLHDSSTRSIIEPLRFALKKGPTPADDGVNNLFVCTELEEGEGEVHPSVTADLPATGTFFSWPSWPVPATPGTPPQTRRLEVKPFCPDFPDLPRQGFMGEGWPADIIIPMEGGPVRSHGENDPTRYDFLSGGGDEDSEHLLRAHWLDDRAVRYLGPNARTERSRPLRLRVEVAGARSDPSSSGDQLRVASAEVTFKLRTAPITSVVDDPTNERTIPGKLSKTGDLPFADHITYELPPNHSTTTVEHDLEAHFFSNGANLDHHIEVTASVVVERVEANSNVSIEYQGPSELLLRAAVLRPRLYFTRPEGPDHVPIKESGIRPQTLLGRQGRQRNPSTGGTFAVELRCHDVGDEVPCELVERDMFVGAPNSLYDAGSPLPCTNLTLHRDSTRSNESWTTYRSLPIVAVTDPLSRLAAVPGIELVQVDSRSAIGARVVQLPGNDGLPLPPPLTGVEPISYHTAWRPCSSLDLVQTQGDTLEQPPCPRLAVDVADDASWVARLHQGELQVQIDGTVQDPLADVCANTITAVTINSGQAPIIWDAETSESFVRKQRGTFSHWLKVHPGVQLVTIEVTNELGGTTRQRFRLELTEQTNDFQKPMCLTARVRPLGDLYPPREPAVCYLYSKSTWLGPRQRPRPYVATVEALDSDWRPPRVPSTLTCAMSVKWQPANAHFSAPFLLVSSAHIPAGTRIRDNLLAVPAGGVLELSTTGLPNALGPLASSKWMCSRYQDVELLVREGGVGALITTTKVSPQDRVQLQATVLPLVSGLTRTEGQVFLADPSGGYEGAPGSFLKVRFQGTANPLAMTHYEDPRNPGWHEAEEIAILGPDDEVSPGEARLRVTAPSLLVAQLGQRELSVPVLLPARRVGQGGRPMPQEGHCSLVPRLGQDSTVVPGTGEFVYNVEDQRVQGAGPDVVLARSYRSGNDYHGPLGPGWHASWDQFLWLVSDDEMRLMGEDAQVVTFQRQSNGTWKPSPGYYAVLEESAGGFQLRLPQGEVQTFLPLSGQGPAAHYALSAAEDRHRNRVNFVHGTHGRVVGLLDSWLRTYQVLYDLESFRVRRLGNFSGHDLEYHWYDPSSTAVGALSHVLSPELHDTHLKAPLRRAESYVYETGTGRPRLESIQDGNGNVSHSSLRIVNEYDSGGGPLDGRVVEQQSAGRTTSFDRQGQRLEVTDPRGNRVQLTLEQYLPEYADRVTRTERRAGSNRLVDRYDYNDEGELVRHDRHMGDQLLWTYDHTAGDYRDRGNLLRVRHRAQGSVQGSPRTAAVHDTSGMTDYTADPAEQTITELTEEFRYHADLQMVKSHQDEAGRVTTWDYDQRGRLTEITEPGGRKSAYRNNNWGQPLWVRDPNGVVTRLDYYRADDPSGGKTGISTHSPLEPGGYLAALHRDVPPPPGWTRSHDLAPVRTLSESYGYDDLGRWTSHLDARGAQHDYHFNLDGELLERSMQVDGVSLEIERHHYDWNGNLARSRLRITDLDFPAGAIAGTVDVTTTFAHDRAGHLIQQVVDAGGLKLTTTWKYDDNGNLRFIYLPVSNRAVDPVAENYREYRYDEANRCVNELAGPGSSQEVSRGFEYDLNDECIEQTDQLGGGLVFERDSFGRVVAEVNRLGNRTEYGLDRMGRITRQRVKGDVDGQPSTAAELPTLSEAIFFYDEAGRPRAIAERAFTLELDPGSTTGYREIPQVPSRRISQFDYDLSGNQTRTKQPWGEITETTFDGHGLPVLVSHSPDRYVEITYRSAVDPYKVVDHDPAATLETVTHFDGHGHPRWVKVKDQLVEKCWYDSEGRVRLKDDALGNRTETCYDAAGRILEQRRTLYPGGQRDDPNGNPQRPQNILVSSIEYDENGNPLIVQDSGGKPAEILSFGAADLVETRTLPDDQFLDENPIRDENPGPETYQYSYRRDGLLEQVVDPQQRVIEHQYDLAGRISARDISAGNAPLYGTTQQRWRHDGAGRMVDGRDGAPDPNDPSTMQWMHIEQRYNSLGLLTETTQEEEGTSQRYTVRCEYDTSGQQTTIHYPDGLQLQRDQFDTLGRPRRIHVASLTPPLLVEYEWTGTHFGKRTDGSSLSFGVTYDGQRRVEEAKLVRGRDLQHGTPLFGRHYQYNHAGLKTEERDLRNDDRTTLTYDSLYRQVEVWQECDKQRSSHYRRHTKRMLDFSGNPLLVANNGWVPQSGWKTLETYQRTFNTANQLGSERVHRLLSLEPPFRASGEGRAHAKYHYDRLGNLERYWSQSYRYDFKNRLVEVENPNGEVRRFRYDVLDRCVLGSEQRRVWLENDVVATYSTSGQQEQFFFYGAEEGEYIGLLAREGGNNILYYPHSSLDGEVLFLSDTLGNTVAEEYHIHHPSGIPYTVTAPGRSPSHNPILREGQYFDRHTGLFFIGGRVYHPQAERFIQRDPDGALQDPLSFGNPYAYGSGGWEGPASESTFADADDGEHWYDNSLLITARRRRFLWSNVAILPIKVARGYFGIGMYTALRRAGAPRRLALLTWRSSNAAFKKFLGFGLGHLWSAMKRSRRSDLLSPAVKAKLAKQALKRQVQVSLREVAQGWYRKPPPVAPFRGIDAFQRTMHRLLSQPAGALRQVYQRIFTPLRNMDKSVATRAAKRLSQRGAGAAVKTAAGRQVGRLVRLIPLTNAVVAGLDVASMVVILDSEASVGKKVLAVATAGVSTAAIAFAPIGLVGIPLAVARDVVD